MTRVGIEPTTYGLKVPTRADFGKAAGKQILP